MNQPRKFRIFVGLFLVILAVCAGCDLGSQLPQKPPLTLPGITTAPPVTTQRPTVAPTLPPTTHSTLPTTVPTVPTTIPSVPTVPPAPPTELPTFPTEPPTEPTEPPTEPTEPPTEPTEPPTEPTEPPTEPTDPPKPPSPPADLTLSAQNAFVFDMDSDEFLCVLGDLDQVVEPASITKLFSAYVGLLYLSPDMVLTAGDEVNWIDPESSRAYIYKGNRLTVEQCIQGMIIPSGNDAAYVLAVNAGRVIAGNPNLSRRDAYDAFVAEMNRQAQAMGMTGTHFVNPDGMNEANHYTTLRDLLTMARLALDTPLILEAAQTQTLQAVFISGHRVTWTNSNQLLDSTSQFYSPAAIGLKTGSTSTAGKCLLSAFRRNGRVLLVCVMGCPTNADRYEDTLALYKAFR